jgi:hypothetical protein
VLAARSALVALLIALVVVPYAIAESQSVQGTGAIKRMSVDNAQKAVTVKLKGLEKPCAAHYFRVLLFWGKKKAYQADGGCYQGKWITSLYYYSNRDSGTGGDPVGCERFKLAYDKDKSQYRVFVPRKCLDLAPDKIKVRAEGDNYSSPMPGEAGPTKALARG